MKRRRLPDSERISLFPFLAVLICTMGALLVLLVVIAQRVQATAQAEQQANRAEMVRSHRAEAGQRQEWEQQLDELQRAHEETSRLLAKRRHNLAHIEDHMRRLREELAVLQESAQRWQQARSEDTSRLATTRQELARITAQIREAEALLAETQKQLAGRQPSYAVVPYEGPHGTRRQPIYLDCRGDSIVLQPEGITLSEQDFRTPQNPDNPLAAVLRVSSEYLHRTGQGEAGRPYPLLLVRPAGIRAYYAARAALQSWDSEFGYELIGDDWEIDYPVADPQLAQVAGQELVLARKRQEMYLAGQPGGGGGGGRGAGDRLGAGPGDGRGLRPGDGPGDGAGRGPGDASGDRGGANAGDGLGDGPGDGSAEGRLGSGRYGQGGGGPEQEGGQLPRDPSWGESSPSRSTTPSSGGASGGGSPQGGSTAGGGATAPAAGGGAAAMDVAVAEGTCSLADARGRDWALPDASRAAIPFTRPVRVEVHPHQLIIASREANQSRKTIALAGPTEDAIEEFVSAVWDHMKSWGIAGRGMYWKPILNLYVTPGAERRAAELEILLDGSGLQLNRR